jgi:hypothetical protein
MTHNAHETLQRLYEILIETLGLSEKALRHLKSAGITSIADCVRFYFNCAHYRRDESVSRLWLFMYGEVEPKLQDHGYWSHVLNAEIWDILSDQVNDRPRKMIVMWQDEEKDLYQVPIEELGLSDDVREAVRIFNLKTIGQWLHEYCDEYPSFHEYGESYIADDLYSMMLREILIKVQEQDGWYFIADKFDPE